MTDEISIQQAAVRVTSPLPSGRTGYTGGVRGDADRTTPQFNRYIYENLLCHVEGQIECWNRKAVRDPSPDAAHALWLKAEGLGYALRLLYAFGPEFRDLIDAASCSSTNGNE